MTQNEGSVPLTYKSFIDEFVKSVCSGLSPDGEHNNSFANRLNGLQSQSNNSNTNAATMRFTMGGDNNLYMQVGVSLLHGGEDDNRAMASSYRYGAETLNATREGLLAAAKIDTQTRRSHAEEELNAVFHAINKFGRMSIIRTLLQDEDESLTEWLDGDTYNHDQDIGKIGKVLKVFMGFLKPDASTVQLRNTIEAHLLGYSTRGISLQSEASLLEDSDSSSSTTTTDSGYLAYVKRHNLGDHSPPLSGKYRIGNNATGLLYELPNDNSFFYKLAHALKHDPVPQTLKDVTKRTTHSNVSMMAGVSAAIACNGTYVVPKWHGNVSDSWKPVGRFAVDMAASAAIEHAIRSCTDAATGCRHLGEASKQTLLKVAAGLKLKQIPHLSRACAHTGVGGGNDTPTPSVPNPSAPPEDQASSADGDEQYDWSPNVAFKLTTIVKRGIRYAFIPTDWESTNEINEIFPSNGTPRERRSGIWSEALREVCISTDRLWTFVRMLSGVIGEGAESLIITADDASLHASRQLETQRKQIADRVAQFHSRIIEVVMSSLLGGSNLQLSMSGKDAANYMTVVDKETAKQVQRLSSGESGRPFFEANVLLKDLMESTNTEPRKLSDVIQSIAQISQTLHKSLNNELMPNPNINDGISLAELSAPRNSYFVRLREDTAAAIRVAYDRFLSERDITGGGRFIWLWELVEGSDNFLCSRFAEFVGHVLVQSRISTGVSAIYASRQQIQINSAQARVSLARLVMQAHHYSNQTPSPNFDSNEPATARKTYFEATKAGKQQLWSAVIGSVDTKRQMLTF